MLYIHIPFCVYKCAYCNFYSVINMNSPDLYKKYLDALIKEFEIRIKDYKKNIETIYIGGGTPSIIGAKMLEYFFEKLFEVINKNNNDEIDEIKEITIEFNINDINKESLKVISQIKNIRLSIGIQTFNEESLKIINRKTDKNDIIEALKLINKSNIENISVDFICGLPLNDKEQSKKDILQAFDLLPKIKHISLYYLELNDSLKNKWRDFLPVEEDCVYYYNLAKETIESFGLIRYEISNYAFSNYESIHNSGYWDLKDYLGIGAGAFGCYKNSRYENTKNIKDYLEVLSQNKLPVKNIEYLDSDTRKKEFIFLSLRTSKGINFLNYKKLFKEDFIDKHSEIINRHTKYFIISKEYLSIKKIYFDYADEISLLFL